MPTKVSNQLFELLDRLGIQHQTTEHDAAFTVEDARRHTSHIPGGHTKNLLLMSRNGDLWLVICLDHQPVKINGLSRLLGIPKLSFAKPEVMLETLGVEPGSVSPFALINDTERRVAPVLDQKLLDHDILNFHPLTNEATTSISSTGLLTFLESLDYHPAFADLDLSLTA